MTSCAMRASGLPFSRSSTTRSFLPDPPCDARADGRAATSPNPPWSHSPRSSESSSPPTPHSAPNPSSRSTTPKPSPLPPSSTTPRLPKSQRSTARRRRRSCSAGRLSVEFASFPRVRFLCFRGWGGADSGDAGTNVGRAAENLANVDFNLTEEDLETIGGLDIGLRCVLVVSCALRRRLTRMQVQRPFWYRPSSRHLCLDCRRRTNTKLIHISRSVTARLPGRTFSLAPARPKLRAPYDWFGTLLSAATPPALVGEEVGKGNTPLTPQAEPQPESAVQRRE